MSLKEEQVLQWAMNQKKKTVFLDTLPFDLTNAQKDLGKKSEMI